MSGTPSAPFYEAGVTTLAVHVTGIHLFQNPIVTDSGFAIVAHFDCEVPGFRMSGCGLGRSARGWAVTPPRVRRGRYEIRFNDRDLRSTILDAALTAYRAMGGVEPDPAPNGNAEPPIEPGTIPVGLTAGTNDAGLRRMLGV
jgi:hypothetical protein